MSDFTDFDFSQLGFSPPLETPAPAPEPAPVAVLWTPEAPPPSLDSWQAPVIDLSPPTDLSYGAMPWEQPAPPAVILPDPVVFAPAPEPAATPPQPASAPPETPPAAPDMSAVPPEHQPALARIQDPALRQEIAAALADPATAQTAGTLLQQIDNPDEHIDQVFGHSCVAATTQKILAETNPAGYFRLGMGLAQQGAAPVRGGQIASVNEANRAWIAACGADPETTVDMLFQAALTELGNGGANFDAARDASFDGDGRLTGHGLHYQEALDLNSAVLGLNTLDGSSFQARLSERSDVDAGGLLAEFAAGGAGIMVPMLTAEGSHMVMLKGVDLASGQVSILDAYGKPRQLALNDFLPRFLAGRSSGDDMGTDGTAATTRQATRGR